MKIVKIIWRDALAEGGRWMDEDELDDFADDDSQFLVSSVGYELRKTKDYITLMQNHCLENNFGGNLIKIPRRWIVEYTELK
ncbi:MAG: hypothetical protein D6707_09430 [Bacteroidetes bacterium]|nr:MAG: hypothetical protein D6707_09430 [Bacteroidota bacterium]